MSRYGMSAVWGRASAALFSVWLVAASAVICMFDIVGSRLPEFALLGLVTSAAVARPAPLAGPVAASLAVLAYGAVMAPRAVYDESAQMTFVATSLALLATGIFGALVAQNLARRPVTILGAESITPSAEPTLSSGVARELHMRRMIADEVSRARRYKRTLSLLIVGVADWPQIVGRFGPAAADRMIDSVGETLQQLVRNVDRVGRHGTREFALLLPETALDGAKVVSQKINRAIRDQVGVDIASGAAIYPDSAETAEELVREARTALDVELTRFPRA